MSVTPKQHVKTAAVLLSCFSFCLFLPFVCVCVCGGELLASKCKHKEIRVCLFCSKSQDP